MVDVLKLCCLNPKDYLRVKENQRVLQCVLFPYPAEKAGIFLWKKTDLQ